MTKKLNRKIILYEFLSVLIMVLPLIILFVLNRSHYLKSVTPLGLSLSGIILVVFAFIMVKDKFDKSLSRVLKFFIFFIFCYIFEPFLVDLKMISFMAFIGVGLNQLLFENKIKSLKEELLEAKNGQQKQV